MHLGSTVMMHLSNGASKYLAYWMYFIFICVHNFASQMHQIMLEWYSRPPSSQEKQQLTLVYPSFMMTFTNVLSHLLLNWTSHKQLLTCMLSKHCLTQHMFLFRMMMVSFQWINLLFFTLLVISLSCLPFFIQIWVFISILQPTMQQRIIWVDWALF